MTNHEGHIKLWDELARTGGDIDDKFNVFDTMFNDVNDLPFNACFACIDVVLHQKSWEFGDDLKCEICPIDWGVRDCQSPKSPYFDWEYSDDPDERKRLAAIIRDLPWTEKS